jgi:pimeloyl-ACP methyl ester carboxylesterase
MLLVYTHGLGGSPEAQPEIDEVFAPSGYQIKRVAVPYHESVPELLAKLATSTFGDLCTWVHDGANILIATAQQSAPESYVVVGDSLGGFISLVAAQRDRRITHCILLSCSGDFCDAMMRLDKLNPALALLAGNFTLSGKGGIKAQAHKAIAGQSDFQHEFDLINTLQPDRLRRLCPLLILGDRGDPVAPENSCRHFAQAAPDATVRMVYDEGRHHSIGKQELTQFVLPFLRDQAVPPSRFAYSDLRSATTGTSVKVNLTKIWQWLRS